MARRQFRRLWDSTHWCTLVSAVVLTVATSSIATAAPKSLVVVDANTGAVLIDQDGSDPRSPASLTKMMTLYMAFEALERGSVTMRTPIRISTRAETAAPSKLDLDAGDTIALEDAIKALITKSANDVAIALAEHFAGSEEAFARSMTAKARELGMVGTTFKNASGLPDSGQITTARDMVTLSLRLYDTFPKYFALFSTRSFVYGGKTYKNHNTLMIQMPGVNGIKTGYTNASGFNLVTSYEVEGRHLIAAIFGGDSAASRNAAMRVALTRTISKASTAKTRRPLVVASTRTRPPVAVPAPSPAVRTANLPPPQVPVAARDVPQPVAVARSAGVANVSTPDVPKPRPVADAGPSVVGPNVQIAKVRPVDVGPPGSAADRPDAAWADRQQVANASPSFAPPSLAAGFAPSPKQILAPPPVALPASPALAPPAPTAPQPSLARPPSSLDQQHASLSAGLAGTASPMAAAVPVPKWRLNGPAFAPATGPASQPSSLGRQGGFEVQIGALNSPEEADRLLAMAQTRAGPALAGRAPVRKPVAVNGRTLQRARFTGFDQASAATACAELARQQFSCLVVRAD